MKLAAWLFAFSGLHGLVFAGDAGPPELVIPTGHSGPVVSAAFSRSGQLVVTGGRDGSIVLWEAATGRQIRRFTTEHGIVTRTDISVHDQWILAVRDGIAFQWDAKTREHVRSSYCNDAVFMADDEILCALEKGGLGIISADPTSGELINPQFPNMGRLSAAARAMDAEGSVLAHVAVPADSSFAVATGASDGSITRFDLQSGNRRWSSPTFCPGTISPVVRSAGVSAKKMLDAVLQGKTSSDDASVTPMPLPAVPSLSAIAVSPDGRTVGVACNDSITIMDALTGQIRRSWKEPEAIYIPSITLSPNGSVLAFAQQGPVILDSQERFVCMDSCASIIADTFTSKHIHESKTVKNVAYAVGFDPVASRLLTTHSDGSTTLVDLSTNGSVQLGLSTDVRGTVSAMAASDDGHFIAVGEARHHMWTDLSEAATAAASAVTLWDTSVGHPILRFLLSDGSDIAAVSFSSDNRYFGYAGNDWHAHIVDLSTLDDAIAKGQNPGILQFPPPVDTSNPDEASNTENGHATAIAITHDSEHVAVGFQSGAAMIYNRKSGKEEFTEMISPHGVIWSVAFSPDDKRFACAGSTGELMVFGPRKSDKITLADKKPLTSVNSVVFTRDGQRILTASGDGYVRLWNIENGEVLWSFMGLATVKRSAIFTSNDEFVVAVDEAGVVWVLKASTGKIVDAWSAHDQAAISVTTLQGQQIAGQLIVSAGEDNSVKVWSEPRLSAREVTSHAKLLGLMTSVGSASKPSLPPDEKSRVSPGASLNTKIPVFRPVPLVPGASEKTSNSGVFESVNAAWAVVEPGGRFDFDTQAEDVVDLFWILPQRPFSPQQLTLFTRDYFEPGLLPRVLTGSTLPAVRPLSSLNLARPAVRIASINQRADDLGVVDIHLDVQSTSLRVEGDNREMTSGVYDVRLFRNGHLVGRISQPEGEVKPGEVFLPNVRLEPGEATIFSAYAFNSDSVRSERAVAEPVRWASPPMPRRLIILAIGVDITSNGASALNFAASDATTMATELPEELNKWPVIEKTLLVSDRLHPRGATKTEILRALDQLVENGRPSDFVIISFSGHGSAEGATFNLLASDAPISSDEIGKRLRLVDSDHILLIIDACQAAASVDNGVFKPVALPGRSLGQIAYDKAMTVLAATQADNSARERVDLRHGLLTYALVEEGLREGKAVDEYGRTFERAWLNYASRRVPELHAASRAVSGDAVKPFPGLTLRRWEIQRPVLFDFSFDSETSQIRKPISSSGGRK